MRNYIKSRDMKAAGFELTLDEISEAWRPRDRSHHSQRLPAFRSDQGNHEDVPWVLIGNSAIGLMAMERDKFDAIRDPVVVLIRNKAKLDRYISTWASEWSVKPKAPLAKATDAVRSTIFVDVTGNSF